MPSSKSVELPRDIWLLITDLLETNALKDLLTVNRFFYDLCLQDHYKSVNIGFLGTVMMKTLVRLKDPGLSGHVRHLTLTPHRMHHVFVREQLKDLGTEIARPSISWIKKLGSSMRSGSNTPNASHFTTEDVALYKATANVDSPSRILVDAIRSMSHIHTLTLDWSPTGPTYGDSKTLLYPQLPMDPYVGVTLKSSAANLQTLALAGNPVRMVELAEHVLRIELPQLQDLRLEFIRFCGRYQEYPNEPLTPSEAEAAERNLFPRLTQFINRSSSQLEQLTIISHLKLDISSLFLDLQPIPRLSYLRLVPYHLFPKNPTGLTQLLQTSPSLRQFICSVPVPDECYASWWPTIAHSAKNLHLLKLLCRSQCLLPHKPINTHQYSGSLTTVELRGHAFTDGEVSTLLSSFRMSNVYDLSLVVAQVTPPLFDILAHKCPSLHTLRLHETPPGVHSQKIDMAGRRYDDWKLYDLSIQMTYRQAMDKVHTVAQCIPSVRSYFGSEELWRKRAGV